ncbi:hypothetical protein F4775DRAFT_550358 [Biscogniauxia sp. FL1348]|nr:hypothetical protein F4775DRAFT_550358 [Biscogniauxia sp. FL1348]
MASSTQGWPGMRPVKTCTECKQSKLRCDSRDQFPNPCSRCQTRGLTCTVDPSFRRTPARKRIEAMSRELQELRVQHGSKTRATSTTSTESGFSQDISGTSGHTPKEVPADNFDLSIEVLELGDVSVTNQTAVEAFRIFTAFHLPQLPILGPVCIESIYHTSPFLFWTVIVVVAKHSSVPSDEGLFGRIEGPYQQLVRSEILQAPLPLQTIQALLILCMWPMPVEKQPQDPSWLYCGIAVNAAVFMGLHRHNSVGTLRCVGITPAMREVRMLTWLGCFYVSSSLAMHLGLPPMVNSSDLATITTFLSEHSIPRGFEAEIKLHTIITNFTSLLSHDSNDGVVDSSILRLFDREIDTLKVEFPDQWTRMAESSTLVAKIHIYALVITRGQAGTVSRDILLKLSLSAALRIIHLANARFNDDTPDMFNLTTIQRQRTMVKNYFRGLAFATAFLLRYFSLNNAASTEERQLAANHVILSHTIFKSCSIYPRDEHGRVAVLFETLCQKAPVFFDPDKLRVADRMGVSILLDAINTASDLRRGGEPIEVPQPHLQNPVINVPEPIDSDSQDPSAYEPAAPQAFEPWTSDVTTFPSGFWGDQVWDMFNFPEASSQFHSGGGGGGGYDYPL